MKRAEIEQLAFRLSRPVPSDLDLLQAACIIRGLAHEQDGEALVTRLLLGPAPAGRVPPDSAAS
jgi:hypothetical protein